MLGCLDACIHASTGRDNIVRCAFWHIVMSLRMLVHGFDMFCLFVMLLFLFVSSDPLSGVRVVVTDGQAHAVDSNDIAFQLAMQYGIRQGVFLCFDG